jgi:hypothetical protein
VSNAVGAKAYGASTCTSLLILRSKTLQEPCLRDFRHATDTSDLWLSPARWLSPDIYSGPFDASHEGLLGATAALW